MQNCVKFVIALLMIAMLPCAALAAKATKGEAQPKNAKAESATDQAAAGKPLILHMTIGDPEDSEMGLLGIAFKNYVHQQTNGGIEIKLVYSGGLDADEAFQFHRVQTGKLALAMGGVGNLAPMVRPLGVVSFPYIFPNVDAVVRGTTGKAADLLNSYAEKAGVRILAWTYYGYRYLSNSKHPVRTLEDMKGLKIRVPQSMVMIKTYRAFGSIPTPLAWLATRSALKNDLVDGQCYDYNGFRTMKFRDVGQKYIAETHYIYNLQPLVINLKLFNSLSEADKKIMVDAGRQIQELSLQYQKEMNDIARKALVSEGVHITQLQDEDAWKKVAISRVWSEAADNVGGPDAINAYLKACGLPAWEPVLAGEDADEHDDSAALAPASAASAGNSDKSGK